MRYLWLVGLAAVLGLMLVPMLRAEEGEGGENAPPAVKEGGGEGGGEGVAPRAPREGGEGRGGGRMPAVTLTPEQEEALAPAVAELKAAVEKFKAAVVAAGISEKDAQMYVMRTIFNLVRPAARPAAEGQSTGEGAGGEHPARNEGGGEGGGDRPQHSHREGGEGGWSE
jgi:hypothetical protein